MCVLYINHVEESHHPLCVLDPPFHESDLFCVLESSPIHQCSTIPTNQYKTWLQVSRPTMGQQQVHPN